MYDNLFRSVFVLLAVLNTSSHLDFSPARILPPFALLDTTTLALVLSSERRNLHIYVCVESLGGKVSRKMQSKVLRYFCFSGFREFASDVGQERLLFENKMFSFFAAVGAFNHDIARCVGEKTNLKPRKKFVNWQLKWKKLEI